MPTLKKLHYLLIAAIAAMAVTVHAQADMYKGYEMPPFAVEHSDGQFEIRRYDPHLVAEVAVTGNRGAAIGTGFRILADYIYGGNAQAQRVTMTVPVTQTREYGHWTVRFMMPAAYDKDALPKPNNAAIRFIETAPERHAVIRFNGIAGSDTLASRADDLMAYVEAEGLEPTGSPRFHFYDDPFTLPWKRRNEVSMPIR